jgi:hypothetical protein
VQLINSSCLSTEATQDGPPAFVDFTWNCTWPALSRGHALSFWIESAVSATLLCYHVYSPRSKAGRALLPQQGITLVSL